MTNAEIEFDTFLKNEVFSRNLLPTRHEIDLMRLAYFSARVAGIEKVIKNLQNG